MTKAPAPDAPLGFLADGVTPRKRAARVAHRTNAPPVDDASRVEPLVREILARLEEITPEVEGLQAERERLEAAVAALTS